MLYVVKYYADVKIKRVQFIPLMSVVSPLEELFLIRVIDTTQNTIHRYNEPAKLAFFQRVSVFSPGSRAVNANEEFFARWHNGFYEDRLLICGFGLGRKRRNYLGKGQMGVVILLNVARLQCKYTHTFSKYDTTLVGL